MSLSNHVEGKFLQLPSTGSGNDPGIFFSGNRLNTFWSSKRNFVNNRCTKLRFELHKQCAGVVSPSGLVFQLTKEGDT